MTFLVVVSLPSLPCPLPTQQLPGMDDFLGVTAAGTLYGLRDSFSLAPALPAPAVAQSATRKPAAGEKKRKHAAAATDEEGGDTVLATAVGEEEEEEVGAPAKKRARGGDEGEGEATE